MQINNKIPAEVFSAGIFIYDDFVLALVCS